MAGLGPDLRRAEGVADDDERELSDERRSLHVGDELCGGKEPAVGEDPADERLGGARLAALQVDDGLVEDDELVVSEGALEVADDARVDSAAKEERVV